MIENESLYVKKKFIQNIFFANKNIQGFGGDPLFWVEGGLLPLEGVLHVTNSRTNPLIGRGNDTIHARIERLDSYFSVMFSIVRF